ncbi:hypothetical protein ASZ78_005823 [Callipepla squamata]|uniref:G-protein coupled receptors family 1 profile domain-containing protein n=1 Tax=Callipepla squamata TaxID=9009 RepID=A0A226MB62_CALSU|nr:hypothetical protein ASZ78_005823 [Callipepla squamata]
MGRLSKGDRHQSALQDAGYPSPHRSPAMPTTPSNVTVSAIPNAALGLTLLSLAMVIGLPGNAFVLWSCIVTHRRSIPVLLVAHLSLADVATLLTGPVYIRFLSTGHWDLGLAACRGCNYICAAAMYTSVFLIALLGLHRCLVVSRPSAAVVAGDRVTQLAHGAAAVTWLVALVLATPSIAFRHVENGMCTRNHSSTAWLVTHNLLETGLGWALPLSAVAAGYGLLLRRLQRTRLAWRGRTLRLVAAVVVAFAVTWGPYHVGSLLEVAVELQSCTGTLRKVAKAIRPPATALAFLSSALNPLLYACAGRGLCRTSGAALLPRLLEGSTASSSARRTVTHRAKSSRGQREKGDEGMAGEDTGTGDGRSMAEGAMMGDGGTVVESTEMGDSARV